MKQLDDERTVLRAQIEGRVLSVCRIAATLWRNHGFTREFAIIAAREISGHTGSMRKLNRETNFVSLSPELVDYYRPVAIDFEMGGLSTPFKIGVVCSSEILLQELNSVLARDPQKARLFQIEFMQARSASLRKGE